MASQHITSVIEFYIHGSVHRNSTLIRSNKMQQYAGVYLLQNYSTCFGCPSHPSSGVHQTATAASGTGHIMCQSNNLLPAWPNLGHTGGRLLLWHYDLYQKLQLQFDVFLMMGAIDTRNMQSNFAVNKHLDTVASLWILLISSHDARNHEYKIQ